MSLRLRQKIQAVPRAIELSRRRLHVAAGILHDADGRVLITDRRHAKSMQEYWEFPGGKVRPGESSEDALRRELGEELGIEVTSCEFITRLGHDYPGMHVEIDFFNVAGWQGAPSGVEGQALKWLRPEDLSPNLILPADVPVLDLLIERNRD